MSLLKRIFGGGASEKPAPQPIEYKGFRIYPDPISEDGQFRLAGRIELDKDGETKTHSLIRADLIRDRDEAAEAAVFKAKQMIDQMGETLFG